MKKTVLLAALAIVAAVSVPVAAFADFPYRNCVSSESGEVFGPCYADEDGDGACDRNLSQKQGLVRSLYVVADRMAVCSGYADQDRDGVCDNRTDSKAGSAAGASGCGQGWANCRNGAYRNCGDSDVRDCACGAFTDADGDGVCDNASCSGYAKGSGNGNRHHCQR